jgi:hypothetical protein
MSKVMMNELNGNDVLNGEIVKKMGKQEEIEALNHHQSQCEQQDEEVWEDSFENRTIQINDSSCGQFEIFERYILILIN